MNAHAQRVANGHRLDTWAGAGESTGSSERSGRVEGKVVLVTETGRGTAEQIACPLVAEGFRVVASDVLDDLAKKVVGELGGNALFVPLDVDSEPD